jgi:hypothetical protein
MDGNEAWRIVVGPAKIWSRELPLVEGPGVISVAWIPLGRLCRPGR